MSVPRNSDVSKHLARVPKRTGIVLPFPASEIPSRDDQMNGMPVSREEKILLDDSHAINGIRNPEPLLETR